MDSSILDSLPKEVLDVLDSFVKDGKYVNDFRITGNTKGFSLTIHFCNAHHDENQAIWSPGIIAKSPSNRKRDLQRRHWEQSILQSPSELASDCNKDTTAGDYEAIDNNVNNNKCTDVNGMDASEDKFGNKSGTKSDSLHCYGDSIKDSHSNRSDKSSDTDYSKDESSHAKHNKVDVPCDNDSSVLTEPDVNDGTAEAKGKSKTEQKLEAAYAVNIMDTGRNKVFTKIVHDTRSGDSKVYGMTEDLIVKVDEQKRRYYSYAIYDKQFDKHILELYDLISKWPRANSGKCTYGYKTLSVVLPDIVASEREHYAKYAQSINGDSA